MRGAVVVCAVGAAFSAPALVCAQQPAPVQPVQPAVVPNAPAITDPAPTFAPVIERLITDLGSPLYAVREQAGATLAARADLALTDLEAILERPELSAEQRVRVRTLARERFATTPRGAMGVRFGGVLQQSRIVIDATYEGFSAHDLLKPGDVITEVEGRSLRGDLARYILRAIVFAHDPGDSLTLTVRRGAEKLNVTLRLGSFHVLAQQPQGRPLDDLDLARAWAMRTALSTDDQRAEADGPDGAVAPALDGAAPGGAVAAGEAHVTPIATSLPASQWPTTREQLDKRYKLANARLHGEKGPATIAAGGQFREGGAGMNSGDLGYQYALAQPTHPLEVLTREPTIMDRQRELAILAAMELRTGEELQRLSTMLDSPDMRALPREQRVQTEELVRQYRERLEMIKLERQAIESEQQELGDEEPDGAGPLLEQ